MTVRMGWLLDSLSVTTLTITVIDVNDNCAAVFLHSHQSLTLNRKIWLMVCVPCSAPMLWSWWGRNALHIVNGTLPSIPVGNFLWNARSGELGFAGNISTIDTIALDITVSDSCSTSLSVCVNVSVEVQSTNVTRPQFDTSVFNVTISENTIFRP